MHNTHTPTHTPTLLLARKRIKSEKNCFSTENNYTSSVVVCGLDFEQVLNHRALQAKTEFYLPTFSTMCLTEFWTRNMFTKS